MEGRRRGRGRDVVSEFSNLDLCLHAIVQFKRRSIVKEVLSNLARSWWFAVHVLATRSVALMA
jgi:hypothetical protein